MLKSGNYLVNKYFKFSCGKRSKQKSNTFNITNTF